MALIVNLLGGPGSGKSTTAAGLFYELKLFGINCELVTEYAKDKTWLGDFKTLENQLYVFANQHHRLWRVADKVDVVVTDSPLLLSTIYGNTSDTFKQLAVETYNQYYNMTFLVYREKEYNPSGRTQTEEEAKAIDKLILDTLVKYGVEYVGVPGSREGMTTIFNYVMGELGYLRT